MSGGSRPLGITLVCILGFLMSIISLLIVIGIIFLGFETGFLANIPLEDIPLPFDSTLLSEYGLGGGHLLSALLLVFPIINFIFWWLLWKMNIIAWFILVVGYGLSTFMAISSGAFIAAILPGLFLLYLLAHTGSFLS